MELRRLAQIIALERDRLMDRSGPRLPGIDGLMRIGWPWSSGYTGTIGGRARG